MSSFDSDAGASMATAGELLKNARLDQGLSPEAVASYLHLTPRQVEALERNDYEHLPGDLYIRGFLKNYARFLGVSQETVLYAYKQHGGSKGPRYIGRIAIKSEGPLMEHGALTVIWTLTALLVVAALVLLFYRRDDDLKQVDTVAMQQMQLPAQPGGAKTKSSGAAPAHGAALAGSASAPARTGVPVGGVLLPGTDTSPLPQEMPEKQNDLHLSFNGTVWVEVKDLKGTTLLKRVGKEGESVDVKGNAPFGVTLGNATAAELRLDNIPVPVPATHSGQVVYFTVAENTSPPKAKH